MRKLYYIVRKCDSAFMLSFRDDESVARYMRVTDPKHEVLDVASGETHKIVNLGGFHFVVPQSFEMPVVGEFVSEAPALSPVPEPSAQRDVPKYICPACGHMYFHHRSSAEWQRLYPRRKNDLTGCTKDGCSCTI